MGRLKSMNMQRKYKAISGFSRILVLALYLLIWSQVVVDAQTVAMPIQGNAAAAQKPASKMVRIVEVPDLGMPDLGHYLEMDFDPKVPANPTKPDKPKITAADVEALGNPVAMPTVQAPTSTDPGGRPQSISNSSLVVIARRDNSLTQVSYSSPEMALIDPGVSKVGCTRCGQLGDPGDLNFGYCATGRCTPGRAMCYPYTGDSLFQRVSSLIYQCLSCPDPCYEPSWKPLANAGLMLDSPRPQTMFRLRYDRWSNITTPDRGGFFWSGANGQGLGPKPLRLAQSTKGIKPPVPQPIFANINDATYSMEAGAGGKMAFFLNFPYRLVNTNDTYNGAAGFGDMSLGTKSVIIDSELLLLTFQFKTYLPIGNASNGTGLGVVRLEPSLLWSTKLSEKTYFQGQLGEWVPLGGSNYFGSVLLSKFSLNHELLEIIPNVPLIGVLEVDGWTFQNGRYTQLFYTADKQISALSRPANTQSYWNIGPGARVAFGNKADLGMGLLFGMGSQSWGNPIVTVDFRWMY